MTYEITEHDKEVMSEAIDKLKEAHPEIEVVFLSLSGSRLYGTNGSTADYDIRGCYIAPTEDFLGTKKVNQTIEFGNCGSGEVEFQLHELGKFASLLISPNMNLIEETLSPLGIEETPLKDRLKDLAARAVCKNTFAHVQGMTIHTKKHARKENWLQPKRNLYIFRELLRGIILFETSEFVSDVTTLAKLSGDVDTMNHVEMLLKKKRAGDRLSILDSLESKKLIAKLESRMLTAKEFGLLAKDVDLRNEVDKLVRKVRLETLEDHI